VDVSESLSPRAFSLKGKKINAYQYLKYCAIYFSLLEKIFTTSLVVSSKTHFQLTSFFF
jgi:hypothetical protein